MLFLGKPDYSPYKGYAELTGDFLEINSTLDIIEGRFGKHEGGYVLFAIAKSISDLYKSSEFKAETPVCIIFHSENYTRWSKENPKLPCVPSPLEKLMIKWLESDGKQWLTSTFQGTIKLDSSAHAISFIEKKSAWELLAEITAVAAPKTLTNNPEPSIGAIANKQQNTKFANPKEVLQARYEMLLKVSQDMMNQELKIDDADALASLSLLDMARFMSSMASPANDPATVQHLAFLLGLIFGK